MIAPCAHLLVAAGGGIRLFEPPGFQNHERYSDHGFPAEARGGQDEGKT
jgi:hypothetical protein